MMMNFLVEGIATVACMGLILCTLSYASSVGVSVACMMAYEEGGARGVLSSPECPQWVVSAESSRNSTKNCQFATFQGYREYQEDRVACNVDMKLPSPGNGGRSEEVSIGLLAIFDGHGGHEASEMASKRLFDYFFVNFAFIANKQALLSSTEKHGSDTINSFGSAMYPALEEALLRTIQDIDSEFSEEALKNGFVSGTTGTIALLVSGEFLIANVGDSKALLCSHKISSHQETQELHAEELTRDHRPDREDERARIEASGGFVRVSGVPRVNGILALSRSIGDVNLKRYGVIAEPEITGWRAFTPENSYMVVASDGVFETLTPQNVCDIIHDKASESSPELLSSSSLADWIVRRAFSSGSTDNLSAIVVSDLHKMIP